MRSMVKRLGVVLLVAASSLPAFALGSEIRLPSPRAEWRSLETPNFRIVGDASARKIRSIGEELEMFRASLLWLKPGATERAPVPTLVLAFSNQSSFRPYGAVGFDADHERVGAFHRSAWGNYMLMDASASGENPMSTVYEGYVYFFVHSSYPSTPLWLSTGLAEYFSSFHAGSDEIDVGRPVRYHLNELRNGWRMPLGRLLEVRREDPEYRDETQERLYRAQSWLLVHYALIGAPEMAPRLVDFLGRLDRGEPVASALPAAFGIGIEELEKRLYLYTKQRIFKYRSFPAAELRRPDIGEPVAISRAETLALLGEFLAHAGAADAARAHLAAASELEPRNGDVASVLAFLEDRDQRQGEAEQLYSRAADLPLRRASSAAHAARFALDRARDAEPGSEGERRRLDDAIRAANRAIELDPGYGEPWALRGLAELRGGEAVSAVVTLAEAHRRLPDRADVLYNRFLANLEAGQTIVARSIATGSLERLDPESAAEARRELQRSLGADLVEAAIEESRRRYESGELAAAAEPLREALDKVADPQQKSFLEQRLAFVEKAAAEQRRIDAYNQAVTLANAGKYREAQTALDELLADCGEEEVCNAARGLREQLAEAIRRRP